MAWRNSDTGFGLVTRILHWGMALAVLAMLVLGTRLAAMQPGLANIWLYGLHKSVGLIVLVFVMLRLIWHLISPPPAPLGDGVTVQVAKVVHRLIYVLLLSIPLAGWVGSSATGIDIMLFDRWVVPPIAPASEAWDHWGFTLHGWLTKALMGLLALHIAGAGARAITGDGTLRRMISGRA